MLKKKDGIMAELNPQAQANLDEALMVTQSQLPHAFEGRFGAGASERCIEVPWAAQWFDKDMAVMDIGFTMSSLDWLGLMLNVRNTMNISIDAMDIIKPERVQTRYPAPWLKDILSVPVSIGDIRQSKVKADHYDLVTCISTIEHIGFDYADENDPNTAFKRGKTPEDVPMDRDEDVNEAVLSKVHQALKRGGCLILTTPMGKGGPALLKDSLGLYTRQWEYEKQSWKELTTHRGFRLVEERFFRCDDDGCWSEAEGPDDLSDRSSSLQPHAKGCALAVLEKI